MPPLMTVVSAAADSRRQTLDEGAPGKTHAEDAQGYEPSLSLCARTPSLCMRESPLCVCERECPLLFALAFCLACSLCLSLTREHSLHVSLSPSLPRCLRLARALSLGPLPQTWFRANELQGYLAHKKVHPPLGPP